MERLISEVQKRSLLWIQKHPHQKDRMIIDREWDIVAERTGFSKAEAKKKWRNLRDQFLKEFKRIPRDKTGDPQNILASYPGKWQYFGDLIFLKDAAMTRRVRYASLIEALEGAQNSCKTPDNADSDDDTSRDENSRGEEAAAADSSTDSDTDEDVPQVSPNETKALVVPPQSTMEVPQSTTTSIGKVRISRRQGKKRRRREEKNIEDERVFPDVQSKRPSLGAPEDENSLFLRSLLPYFKRLGPVQQLRVRTKFQEVLLEAMTQT